ncbi:hypothetical protein F5141DRAFT_1069206 [Pisolithus sp. B1]|nr:hypothetical protein F5141DRAFT_1069206 [Pisolithus sp. B1]
MPTANSAPPLPQSCATEHGCVTSDSQLSSSIPPFPSSMLQDSGNPESSSGNNNFMESIEDTNHPEVPANEGIRNVSTWAACNPGEYLTLQTSKLEEIASNHSITVEYLKGLIGGQTHYHNPQKVQQHNMLLYVKALEVNTEIQTMEELEQHVITLNEHCDMKIHGIQVNNVTAAQDILATTDRITKESHEATSMTLFNQCGLQLITQQSFGRMFLDTKSWMFAHQYEQWACTQNQTEKITNKKHIVMNYHSYETAIIETYGVCLVGWPEDVRFTNPLAIGTVAEAWKLRDVLHSRTCFWKKLSKSELDIFATELNAHCVASKTI